MSFHNIDGVKAVQKAREEQKLNANSEFGDIFLEQVSQLFGRPLSFEEMMMERERQGADKATYVPESETPQTKESIEKKLREQDSIIIRKPK